MLPLGHLAKRFAESVVPFSPRGADERWAASQLSDRELALWRHLAPADRRHAVAVARRVKTSLGESATPRVLAAALLHDVGKAPSRLGSYGRVAATLASAFAGHDAVASWSHSRGMIGRIGKYVRHDELGAELLALAESDPLTVDWARQHHLPRERWSVSLALGDALKAADND